MKNLILPLILLYTTTAYASTYWDQPVNIIVGNNTVAAVITNSKDNSIICRGWFKAKTKHGRTAEQNMDEILAPGEQMLLELHTDSTKDPFISGKAKVKCRLL